MKDIENKKQLEQSFNLLNETFKEVYKCNPIEKELSDKIDELASAMTQIRKAVFPMICPPKFKVGDELKNEKFESSGPPYRMIEYSGKVVKVEQMYWYMGMGNESHFWEYSIFDLNKDRVLEVADRGFNSKLYSNTGVLRVS